MLRLVNTSDPGEAYCLFRSSTAHVGRSSNKDIVVINKYISRQHCDVVVASDGSVALVDEGSTAGTYVNPQLAVAKPVPIPRKVPHPVRVGDRVAFGDPTLTFRLDSVRLAVSLGRTSSANKSKVEKVVSQLGGSCSRQLVVDHPPDFFVCDRVHVSSKHLTVLALGVPLVAPGFFTSLVVGEAPRGAVRWPQLKDFLPTPMDASMDPASFLPKPERVGLFRGRTFYFTDARIRDNVEVVDVACGSRALVSAIPRGTKLDFNHVVVAAPGRGEVRVPDDVVAKMREGNVRVVDVREIFRALVLASCDKFTNPAAGAVADGDLDGFAYAVRDGAAAAAGDEEDGCVVVPRGASSSSMLDAATLGCDSRADTMSFHVGDTEVMPGTQVMGDTQVMAESQQPAPRGDATAAAVAAPLQQMRSLDGDDDLFDGGGVATRSAPRKSLDGDEDLFASGVSRQRSLRSLDGDDGDADLFATGPLHPSGSRASSGEAQSRTPSRKMQDPKRANPVAQEHLPSSKKPRLEERPAPAPSPTVAATETVTRTKRRLRGSGDRDGDGDSSATAAAEPVDQQPSEKRVKRERPEASTPLPVPAVAKPELDTTADVWLDVTMLCPDPNRTTDAERPSAAASEVTFEMRDLVRIVGSEFRSFSVADGPEPETAAAPTGRKFRKQRIFRAHPSEIVGGSELVVFCSDGFGPSSSQSQQQSFAVDEDVVDHFRRQDLLDEIRRENAASATAAASSKGSRFGGGGGVGSSLFRAFSNSRSNNVSRFDSVPSPVRPSAAAAAVGDGNGAASGTSSFFASRNVSGRAAPASSGIFGGRAGPGAKRTRFD